ncbi:pentatricopeptide repeat-containing protein At4g08210 [Elaeis guineensis]|uniref:LOW QUALITY PROTEIN: pentatricopeptide repeat-containing protein At4g08210 n=1 Tax=Elaeis guineensis var. tenera TaxID=51953 RepID=A0A6I9QM83_ELAGV|nr:LOW QUALITY PROTEIN: pentatricopeptide repeat-containing protein At4g08210 [Elaeis guineensis]
MNFEAITRALRHCGRVLAIGHGKSLHAQLIKQGFCRDIFVANNIVAMYGDLNLCDDAQRLFDEMPERNVVSWTTSISAHIHAGNPVEALRVFYWMLDNEMEEPNGFTFSAALKACSMVGNLELGKWIHEHVLRAGLQSDAVLMNAILDMYLKCGSLSDARRVFDGLSSVNSTSWNTIIAGYSREGNMVEAEALFLQVPEPNAVSYNTIIAGFAQLESPKALNYVNMMHIEGFKFDDFTFPCALKTCGNLRFEKMGEQIHTYIVKCGYKPSLFIGSSLIDMYANCGQMIHAIKVYDEYSSYKGLIPDRLPLLNSMLSGFAVNRYDRQALDLVSEIHSMGIGLDAFTLSSALRVCINLRNMSIGLQVHGLTVTNGCYADHVVGSVLVDLYAKCGYLEDALRLFHGLPHKDVIAWAGLIADCVQHGSNHLAFSLFKDMMSTETEVDHFVVSSVLKACSVLAWAQGGEQVHAYSIKGGFDSESVTIASLIDMYSKCGNIDDGLRVFESAAQKDTVCWTGMILGCGYNGRAKEAIELFEKMLKSGVEPNGITILGALSACRHAGLVEEACRFFKAMRDRHGLEPSLEHYCCMIDILSRAGCIEEAKQLISNMPHETDDVIHNSLLGACLMDQNNLAKLASLDLLPSSSYDTSGNVTLSNIYASLGMWDASAKFKEAIKKVSIKEAGRSWIEIRS